MSQLVVIYFFRTTELNEEHLESYLKYQRKKPLSIL